IRARMGLGWGFPVDRHRATRRSRRAPHPARRCNPPRRCALGGPPLRRQDRSRHRLNAMGRALATLTCLLFALVLAGCSEPPRGVVLWHPYTGAEEAALKQVVARFESEHGSKVTVLAVPYEAYLAKLEAAIPRGNGPDVFIGPHNRLGEYLRHR